MDKELNDYDLQKEFRSFIGHEKLLFLKKVNNQKAILGLISQYSIIIATILIALKINQLYFYIFAIMIIGSRQHAIAYYMHDAAHKIFLTDKKINDFFGEYLMAFPLFISMHAYRATHLKHHRYTNTKEDPDWIFKEGDKEWAFPMTKLQIFFILIKSLMGFDLIRMFKIIIKSNQSPFSKNKLENPKNKIRVFLYFFISFIFTIANLWWYFIIFWIIPVLTYFAFIYRLRIIAEHSATSNNHLLSKTRTTIPNLFDKIFIAPVNMSYHLEHHIFPNIPSYNLRKLHSIIMKNDVYKRKATITLGYRQVIRLCCLVQ